MGTGEIHTNPFPNSYTTSSFNAVAYGNNTLKQRKNHVTNYCGIYSNFKRNDSPIAVHLGIKRILLNVE